jgi:hypothetical protein
MWRRFIFAIAMTLLVAPVTPARAVIISGTNITFGPPPIPIFPAATHWAHVVQTLNGDYTETWFKFTPADSTLAAIQHSIDESSDWYLVPAGAPFSAASIASGQFAPLVVGKTFYPPAQVATGDFYLGVNTGTGFVELHRSVFGWVKIHNDGATLTALDNAMAYGEPGIYIGTTIAVPEPAMSASYGIMSSLALARSLRLPREAIRRHGKE